MNYSCSLGQMVPSDQSVIMLCGEAARTEIWAALGIKGSKSRERPRAGYSVWKASFLASG